MESIIKRWRRKSITEWVYLCQTFSDTGDRLLEVDGISVQCFTYRQAVDCLSKTGEVKDATLYYVSVRIPLEASGYL